MKIEFSKKIDGAEYNDFLNFKNFMLEFGGDEGRAALQSLKASYWKKNVGYNSD